MHNIVIAGPAQQPDYPLGSHVCEPGFGISQSLGYTVPNRFSISTQADRPNWFGLPNTMTADQVVLICDTTR
jgi:hypothetical protein